MDFRAALMGLAFALMWSSAFTSARIIVQAAPALYISSLRFLIAGSLAMALAYLLGQRIRLTRRQWRAVFIFGICQNGMYLGFNFVAMQTVQASLASIIASTLPLLVAALSLVVLKERLSALGIVGLITGFVGVALIMGIRLSQGVDTFGVTLCILGAVALAVATLTVRSATTGENLLMVVGLQMLVGSGALIGPAIYFETWAVDWSPLVVSALAYTIIFPGIIATVIWFLLVNRIGATKAAAFHFLNPFLGVAVAAVVLSEQLTLSDIVGVAIVMAGILAVQLARVKT
ncbi:MAG: DMT family transporter [Rhodobacteraceae bacterium]|nr:DMT family transporter [Paracoccaceae bacterium]